MSVTKHQIGAGTHPPEKVAFAARGTAGLETDPGKAVAVLSNKTVSTDQ